MFKYVVFDLDNTLYSYDACHETALARVVSFALELGLGGDESEIRAAYGNAQSLVKRDVLKTATSHSRMMYFMHMARALHASADMALEMHRVYWDAFYESMLPFDGVVPLLELWQSRGSKLAVLTNFTAAEQHDKLARLGLSKYFDVVITSEETHFEKPHPYPFLRTMQALTQESTVSFHPSEFVMIGDSMSCDVRGALEAGWHAIHIHDKNDTAIVYGNTTLYLGFPSIARLYAFASEFAKELEDFRLISRVLGERLDMCQAGGGNHSFKLWGQVMVIKASGTRISEGLYCLYSLVHKRVIGPCNAVTRLSIETKMHALVKTYTVHIHPVVSLPGLRSAGCVLPYLSPGDEVAAAMETCAKETSVYVLEKHGIVVTSDESWEHLLGLLDSALGDTDFLGRFRERPGDVTVIIDSRILTAETLCRLGVDFGKTLFPDKAVYSEHGSVFVSGDDVCVRAPSIARCYEVIEVIRSHVQMLLGVSGRVDEYCLSSGEVAELLGREDEQFRVS